MGANLNDIEQLQFIGFQRWIERQLAVSPTLTEPYIQALQKFTLENTDTTRAEAPYHRVMSAGNFVGYLNFGTAWMRAVLNNADQLRQRVAWALSQILVVSNSINKLTVPTANYYDLLLFNAFSNYEDLLHDVTLHPLMGRYLSYLGNRKANTDRNSFPDENYAREIMQLFTIGLWELNDDGTKKLDKKGNTIPTYTNEDIKELARVFTGFKLANEDFGKTNWAKFSQPMQISDSHHDKKSKRALGGIITVPGNQKPASELADVIHSLASHPNTAPFISKRLINHLVTSNPSPEYIKRVVVKWRESNGNLGEVVTAILLDPEARQPSLRTQKSYGRLKDPVTRLTSLLIAYDCVDKSSITASSIPGLQWWRPTPEEYLHQAPARSPTVFNFFDATYQQPGAIADANLISPEFQIYNDVTAVTIPNYFWEGLVNGFHRPHQRASGNPLTCELAYEQKLGTDALIDRVNLLSTSGNLKPATIRVIKQHLQQQPSSLKRAINAVYMASMAPEAALQK